MLPFWVAVQHSLQLSPQTTLCSHHDAESNCIYNRYTEVSRLQAPAEHQNQRCYHGLEVALTIPQPGLSNPEEESRIFWAVSVGYKQHL